MFSPDQKSIVSVGAEGAIFIWETPQEVRSAKRENELPTLGRAGMDTYDGMNRSELSAGFSASPSTKGRPQGSNKSASQKSNQSPPVKKGR